MAKNARLGAVEGWVVTRDGETLKTGFANDFEAVHWLHRRQSQSVDWAVRHEGYDIVLVRGGKVIWSYKRDALRPLAGRGAGTKMKMGDKVNEPDPIYDMASNIEPLYDDMQALYRRWERDLESEVWSERQALREATALAAHMAEAIEAGKHSTFYSRKYNRRDFEIAADEMVEEFKSDHNVP